MMCVKNELQERYLLEKSLLEQHGRVSSLTFEDWLVVKGYRKRKMNEDGLISKLNSNTNNYLYSLKPYVSDHTAPAKICGGYISQVSRDKARKKNKRKRRNKR